MNTSASMLDELIVGQGLAGSLLAWRLIEAGRRVCVIDDGDRDNASRVAAGLLNPLAGRRLQTAPGTREALPASQRLWHRLEQEFDERFFHPQPMLRLFREPGQAARHAQLREDPARRDLAGPKVRQWQDIRMPHGGFIQHRTGWLDTSALLDRLRAWLETRGALLRDRCHGGEFRPQADHVTWRGLRARRVVFCEGWRLGDNPWFEWLPLQPAKGEILDLQCRAARPAMIVNGGCWAIPTAPTRLRLGASNSWRFDDTQPEPGARARLLQGFAALIERPERFRVVAQRAGVRPGTSDRQPFVGRHPRHPRLLVCNGFGARGVLFMPLHTLALSRHLSEGAPLPAAIDIARHARRLDAAG